MEDSIIWRMSGSCGSSRNGKEVLDDIGKPMPLIQRYKEFFPGVLYCFVVAEKKYGMLLYNFFLNE
jgi:hypothetical protein